MEPGAQVRRDRWSYHNRFIRVAQLGAWAANSPSFWPEYSVPDYAPTPWSRRRSKKPELGASSLGPPSWPWPSGSQTTFASHRFLLSARRFVLAIVDGTLASASIFLFRGFDPGKLLVHVHGCTMPQVSCGIRAAEGHQEDTQRPHLWNRVIGNTKMCQAGKARQIGGGGHWANIGCASERLGILWPIS